MVEIHREEVVTSYMLLVFESVLVASANNHLQIVLKLSLLYISSLRF